MGRLVRLIAQATTAEILKRAFFQLTDDLATVDDLSCISASDIEFPAQRDRAALVAAALAFRFDELGSALPAWLASPTLKADQPVFLTQGLDDLTSNRDHIEQGSAASGSKLSIHDV